MMRDKGHKAIHFFPFLTLWNIAKMVECAVDGLDIVVWDTRVRDAGTAGGCGEMR
jgi:hypothetical protein